MNPGILDTRNLHQFGYMEPEVNRLDYDHPNRVNAIEVGLQLAHPRFQELERRMRTLQGGPPIYQNGGTNTGSNTGAKAPAPRAPDALDALAVVLGADGRAAAEAAIIGATVAEAITTPPFSASAQAASRSFECGDAAVCNVPNALGDFQVRERHF